VDEGRLVLTKTAPTSENAAAGAAFKGITGEQLTSLSFEFENDAYHGAGAPRFSVKFAGETGYRFYSTNGTLSAGSAEGWTKVTFTDFGATAVADLFLVQDETGTAVVRKSRSTACGRQVRQRVASNWVVGQKPALTRHSRGREIVSACTGSRTPTRERDRRWCSCTGSRATSATGSASCPSSKTAGSSPSTSAATA
jgi:hypothetical protein